MFEYIRTHKRIMQGLLLLFIFPSFALFGVDSFLNSRNADNTVAKVGKEPITRQEFDQAQRNQLDRLKQAYGPDFDAQMLNTPEAKKSILDDLIARKAIAQETSKVKLAISDDVIQKNILETPGLKNPDDSFDLERYKSLLAMQNMTPVMYEQSLRKDLVVQQLVNSIQNSSFNSKFLAEKVSSISEQEREIQSIDFNVAEFASQVKITDAMLRAYYDKNPSQFTIPEQVNIEYIVLNSDAVINQIQVSDADVAAFYEQNKKNYTTDEQRRASHILLNLTKDSSESEAKAVKAKAESILAQVKKNPELFAKLAKENSQDLGTSENGGDLDYFKRGAMVKAFDDAVFKLKENEISGLVQSEYGIHIIQLTSIRPATVKPFEEVKAQLAAEIKKQKATKAYAEAAEEFSSLVYDQPESLQAASTKLKLKIETINGLSRVPNRSLPETIPSNNPKFLKAIFADESLKKKLNTEAIEVAPNTLVSGRVASYKPASKRSFDEVKATITAIVTQAEARLLAKKAGEAKLELLKKNDNVAGFSSLQTISRLKTLNLTKEEFMAIMKTDVQKLPAYVGVDVANQGYKLFRISKVNAGIPDPVRRKSEAQQIESATAQQELFSYIEALKAKAKVVVNSSALNSAGPNSDLQ